MQPTLRQRGFTLIEVVAVVAIIGIVVLPILSLFMTSINAVRDSRLLLTAAYFAQDNMETVIAQAPLTTAGLANLKRPNAVSVPTDNRYSFTRSLEEVTINSLTMVKVTVKMFWHNSRGEQTYKVVTYIEAQ